MDLLATCSLCIGAFIYAKGILSFPSFNLSFSRFAFWCISLGLCFNLGKFGGKKKFQKVTFFSCIWFRENLKKIRRKTMWKNC